MPSSNIRPPTSELLELHVFYVPEDVWNFKLNTVPVDVTSKFFSAGFIRVPPYMTLRTLREHLGDFLGEDAVLDKYIFLKCIGKKLAVVKAKQETELKLKSFAPPYAFHPELYLLPGVESIYSSSSSTPERHDSNADYIHAYTSYQRPPGVSAPDREAPDQNPNILESSLKYHLSPTQDKNNLIGWDESEKRTAQDLPATQISKQEQNERIKEKYISHRKEGEINCKTDLKESIKSPYTSQDKISASQNSVRKSTSVKIPQRKSFSQAREQHHTTKRVKKYKDSAATLCMNQNQKQEGINQIQVNHIPQKIKEAPPMALGANTDNEGNLPVIGMGRHATGDSGIPESLEERDMEYSHRMRSQQHPPIAKSVADTGSMQGSQTDENNLNDFAHLSPPTPPLLALSSGSEVPRGIFPAEGHELISQLQHIKAERKHLERSRAELVKKVKGLLEQNKLRRYQARDSWKKKYFEAKKVTASLEEVSNKLREDLELHYQKLLVQLEARDIRKKRNNSTQVANSKNNTIIQITTLQHEIEQLRRKVDNARMKLVIEIKMRKQAASDLRALKAELAHKKVQSSLKLHSEAQM